LEPVGAVSSASSWPRALCSPRQGAIAGVVLAFMALDAIVALTPLRLPANVTPAVNSQVLAFTLALSVLTSFAFGLAPALKLSRTNLNAREATSRLRYSSALTRRGGQVLIVAEVAMALVLLTGAALMIRSFSKILAINVGFEPDAVVTMEVVPVDASRSGLAAAFAVTRVIGSFLFETEPNDPLTFGIVVVALAATALCAAWIPARRAAHVDPVKALRAE
jgi:hypothetical protein